MYLFYVTSNTSKTLPHKFVFFLVLHTRIFGRFAPWGLVHHTRILNAFAPSGLALWIIWDQCTIPQEALLTLLTVTLPKVKVIGHGQMLKKLKKKCYILDALWPTGLIFGINVYHSINLLSVWIIYIKE